MRATRVSLSRWSPAAHVGLLVCASVLAAAPCWAQDAGRLALRRATATGAVATRAAPPGNPHEYRRPPPSPEDFARWAREAAPKRMTAAQLDPETGLLAWPRVLMRREYADLRIALDRLFADRAQVAGAIGNDSYEEIAEAAEQMTARLKAGIKRFKGPHGAKDYLAARTFLASLAYEVGFASGEEPAN